MNAGSLDPAFAEREDLTHVEKLVGSATSFVEHFRARGFADIVLSAKAHGVVTTVEVNRALSRELPDVPLHIGVTEAGTLRQGTVKNAAAIGALLMRASATPCASRSRRTPWRRSTWPGTCSRPWGSVACAPSS